MRMILMGAAFAAAIGSEGAETQEIDIEPIAAALAYHMTLTFMCRDDLGGMSHYQAARSTALSVFSSIAGEAQAVEHIDALDKRIRDDPRLANPKPSQGKCVEAVNESLHQIRMERAKLRPS